MAYQIYFDEFFIKEATLNSFLHKSRIGSILNRTSIILVFFIAEVAGSRSRHIDWEEDLEGREAVACDQRVVLVDIDRIPDRRAEADNSEEDTVGGRNVGLAEEDEVDKLAVDRQVPGEHRFAWSRGGTEVVDHRRLGAEAVEALQVPGAVLQKVESLSVQD
jgi:hypothetical protein